MVQLLQHVYPVPLPLRGTVDADAGMDQRVLIAAASELHERMETLGYTLTEGNHYTREVAGDLLEIDILIPSFSAGRSDVEIAGRGFDGVPGLSLAVSAMPVIVHADVSCTDGARIDFTVPIPDVEIAVVLKALAWRSRSAAKDVTDLVTLFHIVHRHRENLVRWRLDKPPLAGARKDAVEALQKLIECVDQGRWNAAMPPTVRPPQFSALLRRYSQPTFVVPVADLKEPRP